MGARGGKRTDKLNGQGLMQGLSALVESIDLGRLEPNGLMCSGRLAFGELPVLLDFVRLLTQLTTLTTGNLITVASLPGSGNVFTSDSQTGNVVVLAAEVLGEQLQLVSNCV